MLVVVSLLHVDVIVRVVDCIVAGSLEYCLGQDPIAFGIPASRNVPSPAGFRVCKYVHTDVHIRVLCHHHEEQVYTPILKISKHIYIYMYNISMCSCIYSYFYRYNARIRLCVCVRA